MIETNRPSTRAEREHSGRDRRFMPYLEIRYARGTKRIKLGEKPLTIGRGPDNSLILPDDRASRHHCVIEAADGGFCVRDLGSRNGTKLNREKISRERLRNGDVVRVGGVDLRFIDPQQAAQRDESPAADAPDGEATERVAELLCRPTIDIDLQADAEVPQTTYEQKLREIIDAAPEKPFTEHEIALVDCQGSTVHAAVTSDTESNAKAMLHEGTRAFRLMLLACFRARATDLHIEPRRDNAVVRIRVDGYMLTVTEFSTAVLKLILGVAKVLCQLDMSRKNVVEDGHFSVIVPGRRVDYRVSLTPSMHGQKLVIRVLDSANAPSRLDELGLVPWMYEKLRSIAVREAGLLLGCGPTGCGKTTTLYSCLREIDVEQRNAITIEDPVEYSLEGATQIPIDHKQGNTFANILRSVLRQDPDVILVGEIRDLETATVAMQAAMTGHLVYSTVHAKDSSGAIFRLLDLGVEAYLVANALDVILAQRLVRVLCPTCRNAVKPTPTQSMRLGHALEGVSKIYAPAGCRLCLRTGYRGRRALFELLELTDAMRDVILDRPSIQGIREIAQQGLFLTLEQYGYQLVAQGVTSMEEISRVSGIE
jgi:general secretion pathway protein E